MELTNYLEMDTRLARVNDLARELYASASLHAHNYDHALWDTNQIIRIAENEPHRDISLPIAAALMHDSGVSRGPYKDHALNGGKNVREYLPGIGFSPADTEEIAVAVEEHNGWEHSADTSRFLYDADTLNKAGAHGIEQYDKVGKESELNFTERRDRWRSYSERLAQKGFYTPTARMINVEMGNSQLAGLELVCAYWQQIDVELRKGELSPEEIEAKVRKTLGL